MDVLLNAMAAEPEDRPTAAQFRDQLSALNLTTKLAPRPLEATPESPSPPRSPEKPVAVKVVEPAAEKERRREHRGLVALAIAAAVVAVVAAIILVNLFSVDTPAAVPTPAQSVTSNVATPAPTPVVVPPGFIDCSEQLGADTYCATSLECWGASRGSPTSRRLGPRQNVTSCTWSDLIAGRLPYDVRRQSQLDSDAHIRRVCTNEIVNSMLRARDRRSDWEILFLGPQQPNEDFFRCIIGRGERYQPLEIHAPG